MTKPVCCFYLLLAVTLLSSRGNAGDDSSLSPDKQWRYACVEGHNWTDADTAILYVYSAGSSNRAGDAPTAFLFTLKFDAEGKCKIVNAQKVPKEDIED
jgi:hypothetical protein